MFLTTHARTEHFQYFLLAFIYLFIFVLIDVWCCPQISLLVFANTKFQVLSRLAGKQGCPYWKVQNMVWAPFYHAN